MCAFCEASLLDPRYDPWSLDREQSREPIFFLLYRNVCTTPMHPRLSFLALHRRICPTVFLENSGPSSTYPAPVVSEDFLTDQYLPVGGQGKHWANGVRGGAFILQGAS